MQKNQASTRTFRVSKAGVLDVNTTGLLSAGAQLAIWMTDLADSTNATMMKIANSPCGMSTGLVHEFKGSIVTKVEKFTFK